MDFGAKKEENHFVRILPICSFWKNFDSISMSKKARHFLKSPQNVSFSLGPLVLARRRRFGDFENLSQPDSIKCEYTTTSSIRFQSIDIYISKPVNTSVNQAILENTLDMVYVNLFF